MYKCCWRSIVSRVMRGGSPFLATRHNNPCQQFSQMPPSLTIQTWQYYHWLLFNSVLCDDAFDNTDFLRDLLANYAAIQCHQLRDLPIQRIMSKIQRKRQPFKEKGISFACFENILFGKRLDPVDSHYKPVLPQSLIIAEIINCHQRLHCAPAAKVVKEIRTKYFYQQGVSADVKLEEIAKSLIPCYRCLLTRSTAQ